MVQSAPYLYLARLPKVQWILSVCWLSFVLSLNSLHALTISKFEIALGSTKGDSAFISGQLEHPAFQSTGVFIIALDESTYSLDMERLSLDAGTGLMKFAAPAGESGITALTLSPTNGKFSARIAGADLWGLANPLALQISSGSQNECVTVSATSFGKRGLTFRRLGKGAKFQGRHAENTRLSFKRVVGERCALKRPIVEPAVLIATKAKKGAKQSVSVRIEAEGSPDSVKLYEASLTGKRKGRPLCSMRDNGDKRLADATADDGIFSCVARLQTSNPKTYYVTAIAKYNGKQQQSPGIALRVVPKIAKSQIRKIQSLIGTTKAVWEGARQAYGDTETARLKTTLVMRGKRGVSDVEYHPEIDSILVTHDSGVRVIQSCGSANFCPKEQPNCVTRCGFSGPGFTTGLASRSRRYDIREDKLLDLFRLTASPRTSSPQAEERTTIKNNKVMLWEGFPIVGAQGYFPPLNREGQHGPYYDNDATALDKINGKSSCPKLSLSYAFGSGVNGGPPATIETLKMASEFGTIVILTHGYVTKEGVFFNSFPWNEGLSVEDIVKKYADEAQKGQILFGDPFISIAPSYVSALGDLSDSLIWGGFCTSGITEVKSSMTGAFISQGAKTFVGFTGYVEDGFARFTFSEIFNRLLLEAKTVDEAYSQIDPKVDPSIKSGATKLSYEGEPNLAYLGTPKILYGQAHSGGGGATVPDGRSLLLVADLPGADECEGLVYKWATGGAYGGLTTLTNNHKVSLIEGTDKEIYFSANEDVQGSQTVTLEMLAPPVEGSEYRSLGTASFEVTVAPVCVECISYVGSGGPACQNMEACCADGIDNDGNGLTDCADFGCSANSNCVAWQGASIVWTTYTTGTPPKEYYYAASLALIEPAPGDQINDAASAYCVRFERQGAEAPYFNYEENREYALLLSKPCQPHISAPQCDQLLAGKLALAEVREIALTPVYPEGGICASHPEICSLERGLNFLHTKYGSVRFAARRANQFFPCKINGL